VAEYPQSDYLASAKIQISMLEKKWILKRYIILDYF
jgi:hypothetical protein